MSRACPFEIELTSRLRRPLRVGRLLRRVAEHTLRSEGFVRGALSIALVGSRAMSTLHARYLGRRGPTDVLAFDLGTDRSLRHVEGEVIICADLAARRARARRGRRSAFHAELALYAVHGILHLAGYDDGAPADYRRMHAREDELLTELGLGPVFGGAR